MINSVITKDWGNILFDKISLLYYEWKKRKEKKSLEYEKQKFISKNKIVVMVNSEEIYNSVRDGVMNDDLYIALLSYGADKDKKEKKKSRTSRVYNLNSTITSIAE